MRKSKGSRARKAAAAGAHGVGHFIGTIFKVLGTFLLIMLVTGVIFTCIFAAYVKSSILPNAGLNLENFTLNQSSVIYCKNSDTGEWETYATLYGEENREWVDYDQMPKYLEYAAVSIEDKRFYEHNGVDWYRTVAAFGNMFLSMNNTFGGSTITQQLIKNITEDDDVTVQRKIMEIFRALELEKSYTKSEIMEWYLNTIYLGEGCYGVGTAAYKYFGKDVSQLTIAECASLVGITNNPSMYDPYISTRTKTANKARQETILQQMWEQGYITEDEYKEAVAQELVFTSAEDNSANTAGTENGVYSWYVEMIIDDVTADLQEQFGYDQKTARRLLYSGGLQIYACVDTSIQSVVEQVYADTDNLPSPRNSPSQSLQSSIVIMDPYTGDILAVAGGTGEKTANRVLNRAVDSPRPPGSSIKPIAVYGPALDLGIITPDTILSDSPDIKLSGTDWFPYNDSRTYSGQISVKDALRKSLNTISAQILDKVTPAVSYQYMTEKFGCYSLVPEDADYAPLALGQLTYGLTAREMANAYSAIANNGIWIESRSYSTVTDVDGNILLDDDRETHSALSSAAATNLTYIMNYAATYGTGYESRLSDWPVAGKTGTTSDNGDRWFAGFTPYYCAAVWTGYDIPEYMSFSGNPATQIWQRIMEEIHTGLESRSFPDPEYLAPVKDIINDPLPDGMPTTFYYDSSTGLYVDSASDNYYNPQDKCYYNGNGKKIDINTGELLPEEKETQVISGSGAFSKTVGDGSFSLNASALGGAALSYSSSDSSVCTVSSDGVVTVVGQGTCTITISAAATSDYQAGSKTVVITVSGGTPEPDPQPEPGA